MIVALLRAPHIARTRDCAMQARVMHVIAVCKHILLKHP
jgi:hypothetical protein